MGLSDDPRIGTVIADRYLLQRKLGAGGMGEVYLAEQVRIKRSVAIKVMRESLVEDPVAVSRFRREAQNASQISHVNVAQVYDFGESDDGVIYLAMEFVAGEPLSTLLTREGCMHAVRAAELVRQTADALVAAHRLGIVHRDLKPDNIMIAPTRIGTDLVKLVDFGISRVMDREAQQITSTGVAVGTPDYMSPEQLSGEPATAQSDLYALALIAFRVLTGRNAFAGTAFADVLRARMGDRPTALSTAMPHIPWPQSLQGAFDAALSADPALRQGDALEFAAAFDGAVGEMPLSDAEQTYLLRLSQRYPTPTRGGPAIM